MGIVGVWGQINEEENKDAAPRPQIMGAAVLDEDVAWNFHAQRRSAGQVRRDA
ncbi:hypothetical protein L484_004558 [Morus notabilis]|uniref:Uncharacterized protein n=1 Tax=Morus notabilis TaxID=981085 RepID=W9QLR2_9ROSA|nr:hypothetical protein L484_004558 [Morus notabilis]